MASVWLGLIPVNAAVVGAFEPLASIKEAVIAALHQRLADTKNGSAEIGAIDPRLRLPACPALDVTLGAGGGPSLSAKVECTSPSWTIYVPVRLHAWVEAVVAAANIAPNTKLTAPMLSRGRVDMFAASAGLLTDPVRAEGKTLRVGLMAGSPILASFLETPIVVHRGQPVMLSVSDGTMVVRTSVVALDDGHLGDEIALQNRESRKVVHATVTGDGSAEIRF